MQTCAVLCKAPAGLKAGVPARQRPQRALVRAAACQQTLQVRLDHREAPACWLEPADRSPAPALRLQGLPCLHPRPAWRWLGATNRMQGLLPQLQLPPPARRCGRASPARLYCLHAPALQLQDAVVKTATLAGMSAALMSAGSAQAAMEVANIAASDNRFGTIALLAVPVLGVSQLLMGAGRLGEQAFCRLLSKRLSSIQSALPRHDKTLPTNPIFLLFAPAVGGLQHPGPSPEPDQLYG